MLSAECRVLREEKIVGSQQWAVGRREREESWQLAGEKEKC